MPVSQTNTKTSKDSKLTAKDIDQLILNRQRQADMARHGSKVKVKNHSLTTEFFEGLNLAQ